MKLRLAFLISLVAVHPPWHLAERRRLAKGVDEPRRRLCLAELCPPLHLAAPLDAPPVQEARP